MMHARGRFAHSAAALAPLAGLVALAGAMTPVVASAQTRPVAVVSVRGVVYDSLRGRPVSRALIEFADLPHTTLSDADGRFRIDSVPAGAHRLTFSAPSLDSLGLFAFASDVNVRAGTDAQLELSTPSFRTMYARLCAPADQPPRDSAIVFGAVRDASGQAVTGARVAFTWPAAVAQSNQVQLEVVRETRTSADGSYGVCGLPATQAMRAQATSENAASAPAALRIDDTRIMRVDLTVSAAGLQATQLVATPEQPAGVDDMVRRTGKDREAFLARKRTRNGVFLEREAFANKIEMGSALHSVPGLDVIRLNGKYRYRVNGCEPIVVIDGAPQVNVDDLLQNMHPKDYVAIEFHRLPANTVPKTWLRGYVQKNDGIGASATCGGILVFWTPASDW